MANRDKFVAGLIAGAVVGTVAALLLSPKTGKENRQFVKDQASRLSKKAGGLGDVFGKKPGADTEAARAGNGASSRHPS